PQGAALSGSTFPASWPAPSQGWQLPTRASLVRADRPSTLLTTHIRVFFTALLIAGASASAPAQANQQRQPDQQQPATSIAARTAGFDKLDGFIPLYVDSRQGKLYA